MKQVIDWFKSIRLRQMLMVLVAGVLLFFTQACGSSDKATATQPRQAPQPDNRPNSELYVPKGDNVLNPYEGGMNNFSDVDPRSTEAGSEAKAKAEYLKENSERNINVKGVNSPQDYVENYRQGTPLPERVKNLGENIGSSTKEVTEGVAKGTQRGLENIKQNTQNAGDYLQDVGKATTGNDPIRSVKQGARDAANAVNKAFND